MNTPSIQLSTAARSERAHSSGCTTALNRNLIDEWDCLAQAVSAEPYLRPGWIRAWWQAFGKKGELLAYSIRTGGQLTAIAPVVRYHSSVYSAANEHSPGFDIVASDPHAAMQLAYNLYTSRPAHVSLIAVTEGNSVMRYVSAAARSAGHRVVTRNYAHSPYLSVAGSFPDYEARLSRSLVTNLNRSFRRLARNGKTSVQLADGIDNLDTLLDESFAVEASGWKGAQGSAINSHSETRNFYRAIALWAAERNMLRLFMLRVSRKPIAMYFGLEHHGICYLLKGGYDESFARYSPGKLLMQRLIEHCFATGVSRIEFLGNATPHKLCWTDNVHDRYRIETFARNVRGLAALVSVCYARPMINLGVSAVQDSIRMIRNAL
jgi:CelD/BcsL family acetyltransferase involved in cellulose biosynthesis